MAEYPPTRKERVFEKLRELDADPKRSLGQNFLISDHVVDRILFAIKSEPFSELVEVGPGLGAITDDLLEIARVKKVPLSLIELDRNFAESWRARSAQLKGDVDLRLTEADALKVDWKTLGLSANTLFVSNLPFQISSSIAIERSIEPAGISRMILMFQKEVAQRISARAKTEDYGLLTVIVQAFWETSSVVDASPKDFHPQPNVACRVLMFKRRREQPFETNEAQERGATAKGFLKFAKGAFSHRRKLLSRNLIGEYFGGKKELLPHIEEVFASQGLLATARAEELDPAAFIRLYLALGAK